MTHVNEIHVQERVHPTTIHRVESRGTRIPYALFLLTYITLWGLFFLAMQLLQIPWPRRIDPLDLLLLSLATFRITEIISEEKVARWLRAPFCSVVTVQQDDGSEKEEEVPTGRGLRRVAGEMVLCPWCSGVWIATLLAFSYFLLPQVARVVLVAFAVAAGGLLFEILIKLMDRTRQSLPR